MPEQHTREEEFARPGAYYRAKPFWSWNGKLDIHELERQIDCFGEMGMGGYFCHSRVGLRTPYLSEAWFACIRACIDKGESAGMESWLYDEDRWPSGTAGGFVTADPALRMQYVRLRILPAEQYRRTPDTLCAFTAQVDGRAYTDCRPLPPGASPQGRTVLHFTVERMKPGPFYNGTAYLNTLDRRGIETFLRVTHERYRAELTPAQWAAVKGIFTDEPHHGAVMCGFSCDNPDATFLTPYCDVVSERFAQRFGCRLEDQLPALFLWPDGEKTQPVKWQYNEVLTSLFIDHFLRPYEAWCHQNGLQFTGHLLHEDSLTAQTCMAGSLMREYAHMDIPGVDVLGELNDCHWIAKQVQSAARQCGKERILSELYGCTGWQMRLENYKFTGDWQALFGVNLRCPHLSWYTMEGEGKRDFPASIGFQSAWYPDFPLVEDYFARIHRFLEEGEPCCDLLVVSPVESVWAMVYPGWTDSLTPLDEDVRRLEAQYAETFRALAGRRIDFDYGDEGLLAESGRVVCEQGQTCLQVGARRYRSVLLSGNRNLRGSTVSLCEAFCQMGGTVRVAGDAPAYVDARRDDRAARLFTARVDLHGEGLERALGLDPTIRVTDRDGRLNTAVYGVMRRSADAITAFLLNIDRTHPQEQVWVELPAGGVCEKWDARDGSRTRLAAGEETIRFPYTLAPGEELLLRITAASDAPAVPARRVIETGVLAGPFQYTLSEPNMALLAYADLRLGDGNWFPDQPVLQADRLVRAHWGLPPRGNEMVQPWADQEPAPVLGLVRLRFPFVVEEQPEEIRLAMETPAAFRVTLNGREGFEPTGDWWVDPAFRVLRLPAGALKTGENCIELTASFHRRMALENLYLLGDFGVKTQGHTVVITRRPATLTMGDVTDQGLPFYSGRLGYACRLPAVQPGCTLRLKTEELGAALIRVSGPGGSCALAFPPYEADVTALAGQEVQLAYVFTRRNAFGSADGQAFSFLRQGMLAPVRWEILQEMDGSS